YPRGMSPSSTPTGRSCIRTTSPCRSWPKPETETAVWCWFWRFRSSHGAEPTPCQGARGTGQEGRLAVQSTSWRREKALRLLVEQAFRRYPVGPVQLRNHPQGKTTLTVEY